MREWLRVLGFELNGGKFGCYAPPFSDQRWLERFTFMEKAGARWWPVTGGLYVVRAVKRCTACASSRRRGGGSARAAGHSRRYRKGATRIIMSEGVVEIYSDGACRGNPGPGGWGVLLRTRPGEGALGRRGDTTNNRMELMAAIRALEALKRHSHVRLYTDSLYVMKGIVLDQGLEAPRLAHRRQEACQERGSVAPARGSPPNTT